MNHDVGRRRGLDPVWLWLWCRPAAAALIHSLAWEFPYAMGAALKRPKKKKKFKLIFFFLYITLYLTWKLSTV